MTIETAVAENAVTLRRVIGAPRERLFRAWTEPEQLKRWFHPTDAHSITSATMDVREGGDYRIVMVGPQGIPFGVSGVYRQVDPPEKLVFTWGWEDPEMNIGETLVTLEFHDREGSTELTLIHERLPDAKSAEAHAHGWSGCLDRLDRDLSAAAD